MAPSKKDPEPVEAAPEEQPEVKDTASPRWPFLTKFIVGLVLAILAILLIIRFQEYVTMVVTAFMLSFLFYPMALFLQRHFKINWRLAVMIVYFSTAGLLIFLLARGGTGIITQIQSFVDGITKNMGSISDLLDEWSNAVIHLGPFEFKLPSMNTDFLTTQITERLQPMLGQAGTIATKVVGSVGNALFQFLVVYMVSFFIASETGGARSVLKLKVPGYEEDIKRMGRELSKIWNAFIRGQFIVVGAAIVVYTVLLAILGLPYFILLAIIAGIGRFVPYIGAWVGWISIGIAALLRTNPPFGMTELGFMALVLGVCLVVDAFLDHGLTPKLMGDALSVHPAAIMISALVMAQIMGLVGIIIAAPVVASLQLFLRYIIRKLSDSDPWEGITYYQRPKKPAIVKLTSRFYKRAKVWMASVNEKLYERWEQRKQQTANKKK